MRDKFFYPAHLFVEWDFSHTICLKSSFHLKNTAGYLSHRKDVGIPGLPHTGLVWVTYTLRWEGLHDYITCDNAFKTNEKYPSAISIPFVFAEVLVTFCSDYSDNLLSDYLSFSLKVSFQILSSKIMSDIWSVLQAVRVVLTIWVKLRRKVIEIRNTLGALL